MAFIQPDALPEPLDGAAFVDFIQGWIVGLTGMPGELVRPTWQPNVPNVPDFGKSWASIGILSKPYDTFPFTGMVGQQYQMQRHERVTLHCIFYDLGDTGEADKLCDLMRDNAIIGQNRDYLKAQSMNLVSTGERLAVPVLLKERWQYRADMQVILAREVQRAYSVPTVLEADIRLLAEASRDEPIVVDIKVVQNP